MAKRAILIWYWGRRGAGPRYTMELARAMAERGDVDVHLSLSRQSELFEETRALGLPGIHMDTYEDFSSFLAGFIRIPVMRRRLAAYIRAHNIETVHCTMDHLWNTFVVGALKRAGAAYSLTLHDAYLHPGEESRMRDLLRRWDISYTDALVTPTHHVRDAVVTRYAYDARAISVVPLGVFQYGETPCEARPLPSGRPIRIGLFGRILRYKGLPLLIEAARLLRERNYNTHLCLIGSGEVGPYMEALKAQEAELDIRWIPEDDIEDSLARLDLLVLPYTEASQSGVIPAAYSIGLPVVVTPVGGLVEQVKAGETGIVARAVNAAAVADAIASVIDRPELYKHLSAGAMQAAKQDLSWENIAQQMVEALPVPKNRH